MRVTIRYANKNDADALSLIYSQSFCAAFNGIIPENTLNELFSFEKRRAVLTKELSEGLLKNIIAFHEERPIGLLTYGNTKDTDLDESYLEVLRIYILPGYWRQNVGTELMNWGVAELYQKGYEKITLWVLEENIRARKFYEKLGFIHDGITRTLQVGKALNDMRYIKYL